MSHAPSLLYPSHLSTASFSTCTLVRHSSTRPSTRLLQCHLHTQIYLARIHRKCLSVPRLKRTRLPMKEREFEGSTRHEDQSINARTCLSRGVPADHEARSQVKSQREDPYCWKEVAHREASNEVATEFRDVEMPTQQCKTQ